MLSPEIGTSFSVIGFNFFYSFLFLFEKDWKIKTKYLHSGQLKRSLLLGSGSQRLHNHHHRQCVSFFKMSSNVSMREPGNRRMAGPILNLLEMWPSEFVHLVFQSLFRSDWTTGIYFDAARKGQWHSLAPLTQSFIESSSVAANPAQAPL